MTLTNFEYGVITLPPVAVATTFVQCHFYVLGGYLYNMISTILHFHPLCGAKCKKLITKQLTSLDYDSTGTLLI